MFKLFHSSSFPHFWDIFLYAVKYSDHEWVSLVVTSKLLMRFDNCIYHPRQFLYDSFQPVPTCHSQRQLLSDFCHHELFLSINSGKWNHTIFIFASGFFHSTFRFSRFIPLSTLLYQRSVPFCYWAVYHFMNIPPIIDLFSHFLNLIMNLCNWKTWGYKYWIFGSNPSDFQFQELQAFVTRCHDTNWTIRHIPLVLAVTIYSSMIFTVSRESGRNTGLRAKRPGF